MYAALGRLLAALLALVCSMSPGVFARGEGAGDSWSVPVIMYHHVDTHPSALDPTTIHLTVLAPDFEAQLHLLHDRGYRSVTLEDLWTALGDRTSLPPRLIALTFDDGYDDNYTVTFPMLRRYGFVATFFVVTSRVGTPGHLTQAQIKEMARAGMAFESHGVHHYDFTLLPLPRAQAELVRSREMIEAWTGHPVTFFAYPGGRHTPELEHLLGDLGYRGALTEVPGFVTPTSAQFALERFRVDNDETLVMFARTLGISAPLIRVPPAP